MKLLAAARRMAFGRLRSRWWIGCAGVALLLFPPWVYIQVLTPPPGPVALPPVEEESRCRLYVVGWGYHTSIVIEQPRGWRLGPPGAEDAPFVEYGWGDRRFMMESNYLPHALVATLLLPTESVSYVHGMDMSPEENPYAEEVYVRVVDSSDVARLVAVLEGEIRREPDGSRTEPFPPVPEYSGRFYPGREYYIFWNNCNAWCLRMLRQAGFDASPGLVFFQAQIGWRLRGFEAAGLAR